MYEIVKIGFSLKCLRGFVPYQVANKRQATLSYIGFTKYTPSLVNSFLRYRHFLSEVSQMPYEL